MTKTNHTKKKRVVIITVIVLVLVVMVVIGITKNKQGGISVQVQKIERVDVISIVSGSGKVQPKTQVNITSEVNAAVVSIPVKDGERVNKGQILIQLDTLQATKDMESALYAANELSAHFEGAQIQLAQLKDNYKRLEELYAQKMSSEQAYKESRYAYKNQEATIKALIEQQKAADSYLEKARDNLNKTTIKAPMDGVITWVDVEVGEIAQAQTSFTQGKTLMILSDLSDFEVEVEIDETDIADLEVSQQASIEIDAFPDKTFAGQVTEIGNTATTSGFGSTDQTTNFKVKVVLLDSDKRIRPGMSATVDITTNEHRDVLAVPIQAIVMRNAEDLEAETASQPKKTVSSTAAADQPEPQSESTKKEDIKGVFLVKAGKAHFCEVETGISDQQNIEIASGLQEQDEVIIGNFRTLRTLKHGDAVKVEKTDQSKEMSAKK
ncbi:efflux RND transporter periplasmic adaptor subunit [bacterium]|nr:efflux RND transporter periplasmic adaptor subunit [bacterium]